MAAITAITGFQNLPNLNFLKIDGNTNGCETINVSGCTALAFLDVSDMYIPNTTNPSLKYLNIEGCSSLTTIYMDDSNFSEGFPDLSSAAGTLEYFDADECGITESLDLSGFLALKGFDLSGNIGLTSVTISNAQPLGDAQNIYLGNCALTETAVNNILVALVGAGFGNQYIDLLGGTNAVPGEEGLAAKGDLELKGWAVDVNS